MEAIQQSTAKRPFASLLRSLPVWLGIAGTIIVIALMLGFATGIVISRVVPADHVFSHEPLQMILRMSFLFISLGVVLRLPKQVSMQWKLAASAAVFILACGVFGELTCIPSGDHWAISSSADPAVVSSLEHRLFRLGAMATFAIPMLVLLATCEPKPGIVRSQGERFSALKTFLLRWEALLFAIGVATLPAVLIAGAVVNRELIWLSPIGADATAAACVAATVRAHSRRDGLAFGGWLLVCIGLAIGLLMGIYSFGGPVPTPDVIGDYNAVPRTLLRELHVVILLAGVVGIALAVMRNSGRSES